MPARKKTQDLSEFYGIYNTTFNFFERTYGYDELVKYWEFIGEEYFSWLVGDIKKRGTVALKDYWMESIENDDIEYTIKVEPDRFELTIDSCSAISFMERDTHYPLFHKYCEHCRVVNSKIAQLSGYRYKVDYDQDKGKCTHVFNK
jgi:hypothetical protein